MKPLSHIIAALLLFLVCAITARAEDEVTYTQVTKQSDIAAGGEYILLAQVSERIYYATGFTSPAFTCSEKTNAKPITNPLTLTLVATSTDGRFFMFDGAKYYYATSSSSISSSNTNVENDNYRLWDITIAADGQAVIKAYDSSGTAAGSNSRLYYSGGTYKRISYGPNDTTNKLYLYRKTTVQPTVSVTVSELGYSTFCCDKALDFSNSSITAYTLTLNGTDIALTSITKVPANTGILLYKEGGATEDIEVCTDELEAIVGNALSAVSSTYTVGDDERIYVLSAFDGVVAFYRAEAGLELPVGKAYITLPDDDTNAKCLSFSQLLPTALTTANTPVSQRPGYNIHGQRVNSCYRGIIITDGKKRITSR